MTASKWYAAIAATLLFALALPAHAQGVYSKAFPLNFGTGDTTAVGMADSSAYVYTRTFQRMYLWLKPSRPCRIAISVYEAGLVDTSTVVDPDTSRVSVWSWRGATNVTPGAQDSLVYREVAPNPTSVGFASYELVYEFPDNGTVAASRKWGSPRGRMIPIRSPISGEWYSGHFTRIRVRVLSGGGVVTWQNSSLRGYSW